MPRFRKLLLAGFFSAFSFYSVCSHAAGLEESTQTPAAAVKKSVFSPVLPSEEAPTGGCWTRFKKAGTTCLRKTKEIKNAAIPVLQFALPFIQDEHLKRTLQYAIKLAQSGTDIIQFNEDGSLKLPDGTQLQNAVFLVFSDNSKFFTEESKMFIPLVMSVLPSSDYQLKIKLTGYIALVDNPATSYVLSFDEKTGNVQLVNEGTTHPTQSFSIFDSSLEQNVRTNLVTYFSEYAQSSRARTEAEKETGTRSAQLFLREEGKIIPDYRNLISQNPTFQFAHLSKELIEESTSA